MTSNALLVGVRCRYCSHLPIRSMARAKGAVYYPKTMISVYQGMIYYGCERFSHYCGVLAAQNIANSHFLVPCNFMPEEIQKELAIQRPKRDASLAGTIVVSPNLFLTSLCTRKGNHTGQKHAKNWAYTTTTMLFGIAIRRRVRPASECYENGDGCNSGAG